MKKIIYTLLVLTVTLCSCDHFDSYKADTKSNKKRFKEYLEVELTSDVKNIYCYADFGTDYNVLISFSCDSTTFRNIIEKKKLKLSNQAYDNGLFFTEEFKWWNKEKIDEIKPYKTGVDQKFWKYLWYDKNAKKAYYEEFSY